MVTHEDTPPFPFFHTFWLYLSESTDKQSLTGLRTVQLIRTKVKGHASGREVETLVQQVLAEHESFTNHFKHVCATLALELQMIAGAFA
jgi:hypothetical protein